MNSPSLASELRGRAVRPCQDMARDDLSVAVPSDSELALFQTLFKQQIGLHLSREKKVLLASRLSRRIAELQLSSFSEYHQLITGRGGDAERQYAIDLITTNETYFFRESQHFDFLRQHILTSWPAGEAFQVWSAASASGEEAYSVAMVLDAVLGERPWRVFGSDISQRVLAQARRGLYPMARGERIPPEYLRRYCLRGQGEYNGQFLVTRALRERVTFAQLNLTALPMRLGPFDLVLLRNVIIYFDPPTKLKVVGSVLQHLRPGGLLFVGHSESLNGMPLGLQMISPSIYRKLP
ncbi:methyltransferase domain-containing protein [Chitiniphilus purpureus]|uniref:Chemotaxis protein methyltransferase n=1 Tax=Chitiniphilus purpureus TaxID=2981137 RepID=A0ABY6DS84_9NEIS|nr:CheR family methyltransferase [Chitiniphilus sp. CD1]UXY16331.1 methyltransferase domain-containing protein [Chitiniphilus sp. CD1]